RQGRTGHGRRPPRLLRARRQARPESNQTGVSLWAFMGINAGVSDPRAPIRFIGPWFPRPSSERLIRGPFTAPAPAQTPEPPSENARECRGSATLCKKILSKTSRQTKTPARELTGASDVPL